VNGVNTSYGYKIPGALQEFQVLPAEVMDGWMLPLAEHVGYAQAALTEPWACVYFSYTNHRPTRGVKKGGTAWYLGSGPVGLMHIEKGIADGAARVVVSETNPGRLARVEQTLGPLAQQRGVELRTVDVNTTPIDTILRKDGVDDILILAPVPALVTQTMPYLARNGVMNVFAGFPDRDASVLPVNFYDLHYKNAAIISTSGAGMEAMRAALEDSTRGRIDPNRAVAAVGGLNAVAEGIKATQDGTYPGRVLIYPQLEMPLTPVTELAEGGVWNATAEARLLGRAATASS
jgi:threonine dehydrogenase-like Zn-dependent dehydrogenase